MRASIFSSRLPLSVWYFCSLGKKVSSFSSNITTSCIQYYDTARYDNRGHFGLKAWMAAHNLIFIQNGYSKYCLDVEVNDKSVPAETEGPV